MVVKKILATMLTILLLFPVHIHAYEKGDGKVLYVGGNGEGNYSSIMAAVNAAKDGYTIMVYSGIYRENVIILKELTLIGIGYPIIDGRGKDGVTIAAENCIVDGFKIVNGSNGTMILSNKNLISNNIIENNNHSDVESAGVYILNSQHNRIINNIISGNQNGIIVHNSSQNTILCNNISNHVYWEGIRLRASSDNVFLNNTFFNNSIHVYSYSSNNNNISYNTFISPEGAMLIISGNNNVFYGNTFIGWGNIEFSGLNNKFISNNASKIGISLYGENETIKNNIMQRLHIDGANLSNFLHNIENNTCNGKEIYYAKNKCDVEIPENVSQIILVNCSKINIAGYSFIDTAGIEIAYSHDIKIARNTVAKNHRGIYITHSYNVVVSGNEIVENLVGIRIIFSRNVKIMHNNVSSNILYGFYWFSAFLCDTVANNFINNSGYAIINSFLNTWFHNYWDDWHSMMPKPILVCIFIPRLFLICPCIPWLNFDWLPAMHPNNI